MTKILQNTDRLPQGAVVATIGMFDGVHQGHATLIDELRRQAAARGLKSAVITFAHHPQHVLRPGGDLRMIMTLDQRVKQLESMGLDYVAVMDFTVELSRNTSLDFMRVMQEQWGVKVLIVGYNHRFGHDRDATFATYVENGRKLGIEVMKAPEYLGEFAPVSSTIVRGLIAAGKVDDACNCMGRPFRLSGEVVHGFHNGRGIGFPTANVGNLDPLVILPHTGAYAVMVEVAGRRMQGMVNVGHRPTLDNGRQLSIEVNIFGFDDDIYGMPITLEFIKFLRLEFKMGSIDELRAQLTTDRDRSIAILNRLNTKLL
ncbi:MAG: riboflavin biosynthesis protein RibF [Bacteroidales bacterium]|nr:riboflavin biosynthesis protein RibF [Candidatus Sodaliphilus limicaballi]